MNILEKIKMGNSHTTDTRWPQEKELAVKEFLEKTTDPRVIKFADYSFPEVDPVEMVVRDE
jgi:hypothetical protein